MKPGPAIHRDSASGGESGKGTAVVVHINWVGPGRLRKSTRPVAQGASCVCRPLRLPALAYVDDTAHKMDVL
jgi:hypothetical protein